LKTEVILSLSASNIAYDAGEHLLPWQPAQTHVVFSFLASALCLEQVCFNSLPIFRDAVVHRF
jgi:hypothetical protein